MNIDLSKISLPKLNSNNITWIIFGALLGVLLPHTAWAFGRFEDTATAIGRISSYVAAFAFEAMIALLTHKLSKHIEKTPRKYKNDKKGKFAYRYLNEYGFGLLVTWAVSTLANLSHAVQFDQGMAIIAKWNASEWLFTIAFGGILPTVSFLFARVLSNVVDDEDDTEVKNVLKVNIKNEQETTTERVTENKKDQIFAYLDEHPEMDKRVTEVAKLLGFGKGYVSTQMKAWREMRQMQPQMSGAD